MRSLLYLMISKSSFSWIVRRHLQRFLGVNFEDDFGRPRCFPGLNCLWTFFAGYIVAIHCGMGALRVTILHSNYRLRKSRLGINHFRAVEYGGGFRFQQGCRFDRSENKTEFWSEDQTPRSHCERRQTTPNPTT